MRDGFIRSTMGHVVESAKASRPDWFGAKPGTRYNAVVKKILAGKPGEEEVNRILDYTNFRQRRDIPESPLLNFRHRVRIMIVCLGVPLYWGLSLILK